MTKSKSIRQKSFFTTVYMGGVILAIVLGSFIIYSDFLNPWLLLIEGVVHLSILVYLGYKIKTPSVKLYAGERIQTAGYLHTLIGFFVAIGLLGVGKIEVGKLQDLQKMLLPVSSALITSILGWLFGGEIGAKEDDSLDKAIEKIAQAFKNLEQRQVSTLDKHLKELVNFYRERNQFLDERINNLVLKIQENNQTIIETFNQLNSVIQGESNSLLQNFNQLNSVIEDQSQSLPQSFNHLGSVIYDQSDSLRYSFNQLSSIIEEKAHSLSINFNKLEAESQNAADGMSNTGQSVQNLAEDLNQILNLIQQLEELIKYVLQERSEIRGIPAN